MKISEIKIIGTRIRELRVEKHLSQEQLGTMLNVSQDTVSLWEKSKSLPPVDIIMTLSDIFGVSCDYLLGKSDY
ncbi:MAG: helix-turn-helix domain-containing protein [Clostridia bacterium]|nr:helix-turn-helix domain-containing protein [Clostridia bacterium]